MQQLRTYDHSITKIICGIDHAIKRFMRGFFIFWDSKKMKKIERILVSQNLDFFEKPKPKPIIQYVKRERWDESFVAWSSMKLLFCPSQ